MKKINLIERLLSYSHEKQSPQRFGRYAAMLIMLLTLGVGQMWADSGYNGESHVYLKVNGTTKYYKVSTDSWSTGATLPGTWGGVLSEQTFSSVLNIQVVGGAVGGWTDSGNSLSGTLFYKVTTNTVTPSSDWISVGAINSNSTYGSEGNAKNCFYYKNNYTTDVTPTTPGTYYLHIKITDGASNNRTSYVKLIVPSFTVAGSSEVLGSNWSATDTDNDMTFSSGTTYTLTKSNVALSTGTTYECKVVVNHSFDEAYPASNKTFTVNTAAHYNVTFSFNASSQDVEVSTTRLYSVTYNDNGKTSGSVPATSYHANGATVTVASNSGSLAKTNYSFNGWNTANNGSGTNYTAGSGTFTMGSSNKTLYAKWTQTVTLNANTANHGSGENGSATATWNGTALTGISHPSGETGYYRTGYFTAPTGGTKVLNADGTFAGENISGYITSSKWSCTGTAPTLYAQWNNTYTVTFDQGSPTIAGTASTTATYGSAMPAITVPSKTGYTFGGYFADLEDEENTKYYNANGTSAKNWNLTSNTTLHAKWTGISYQVAFDANEGTGSMDNQDFTYGVADDLDENDNYITRSGYYFLGWNTNADGSGTKFYDGKSVQNLTTTDGGIVTLYAQWAKTYTLYFLNMGVGGWSNGASAEATTRYAYAFISYDGHEMYPLGTYSAGSSQGTRMTASTAITLPNVGSSPTTWCWSIAGVPEGATIIFSDNTDSHKTADLSGWTAAKPYYCNGNASWYALDGENSISQVTNMSVHIGEGDFASWKYVGIDKHGNGSEDQYAIIWLNKDQTYQFKYSNWYNGGESGSPDDNAYIINGDKTKADYGGTWTLNGAKNVLVKTNSHATGEYKFVLTWTGGTPQTKVYVPRGVNLTTTSPTQALAGEPVTVSFQADAWTNLSSGTDMGNPTYYFEFSKDNSNWTTVATYSAASAMRATASYTFPAQSGYFRVKLVNDHGLASYSGSTAFTAYSTKSFYVYNPYNTSGNWSYLHLYTWDSNDGNRTYNGSFPTGSEVNDCGYIHGVDNAEPQNCRNGNTLEYKGNNWFYITIDERANCFMLVGEATYKDHQTITCYVNNYIADGKYMIYTESNQNKVVVYQAKGASDYRLKYTDASGSRYSPIYNTTLDGTTVTSSIWMNAANGTSIAIEQGTGNNTWSAVKTYTNSSDGFAGLVDSEHRGHGYVFQMQVNFNTGTPASSTLSDVAVYDGSYYVRTDGLTGGWNDYEKADHTMYHSSASLTSGSQAYDYYLCKWIGSTGTNVKFTVANDYNPELVESLEGDVNSTDPLYNRQTLPAATNVRFSWNSRTNTLTRAYLSGSTDEASRYLVLVETSAVKGKIYKASDGSVPTNNELFFEDLGNWVYQIIMMANPGAAAKVTAKYNNKEAEFIPSREIIGGSGDSKYTYRIIYDFKTNILTNAWVADGKDITTEIDLNTNVMVIRDGQYPAVQIKFDESGKVIHAKKLLGVMQFDYNDMVGKMSSWNTAAYENCMYYISFPYDVNVSDIFGVGEMGTDWRLQYYDGAERASKGFFRGDGTTTFWKDVPANGTLKAYVGYSLLLNRIRFNDGSSNIWENKGSGSSVYLYFPSAMEYYSDSIIAEGTKTIHVPAHECTIDRTFGSNLNHKFTDSHWNMLGIPIFQNETGVGAEQFVTTKDDETTPFETDKGYFYEWSAASNSFSVRSTSGYTFNAMHAYMVQFTGDIEFSGSSIQVKPSSAVSRRAKKNTKNYTMELELLRENVHVSRTYVELRDEACDTFALNEDMYMMYTSLPADIYTYAGNYDVSANVLSVQNHIIPVGVEVHKDGNYTFTMPSNFDGTVTLIDTYAQTRTNLTIEDYEVTLSKGNITDRFFIEIDLNKMPTAIDGVEGGSLKDGKAHKFIENGQMYILKNGVLYDARGNRVK